MVPRSTFLLTNPLSEAPERGELEVRQPVLVGGVVLPSARTAYGLDQIRQLFVGHRPAVHLDPLGEVMQVGRGVEPDPVAGGPERRRSHHAGGPLAVRSRHEQDPQVPLRPPQVVQSALHTVQPKPDAVRTEGGQVLLGIAGQGLAFHLQCLSLLRSVHYLRYTIRET